MVRYWPFTDKVRNPSDVAVPDRVSARFGPDAVVGSGMVWRSVPLNVYSSRNAGVEAPVSEALPSPTLTTIRLPGVNDEARRWLGWAVKIKPTKAHTNAKLKNRVFIERNRLISASI